MQRPGHCLALLTRHFFKDFNFSQHSASLVHQQQTRLSEQHFTAGAFKQHHAKFIFKFANLTAKRWLTDMAGIRCPTKVTMLSQRHQVF